MVLAALLGRVFQQLTLSFLWIPELSQYLSYSNFRLILSRTNCQQLEVEVTLRLTDSQSVSQSVSMFWYRTPLWDLQPDITSCRNFAV
jgi:hypothetical protein